MARDAVHQGLEQQQRDQRRFDGAEAARGGVAVGQRGIDRRHPHQAVEDQAEHPPVARRVELQPVADLALRHHGRQPGRHFVAPVPDHPEQAAGDQRRVEDDGRRGDLAAGAGRLERARDVAADQRQDDHPVQRHQEASRRGIIDRRDAALRRAGPKPGAEQQVEGAPVEQRLKDFLAEPAADALGIADLGEHEAGCDHERQQRDQVEQHGKPEGAQRRVADQAVEAFQPRPAQQAAGDIFRHKAGHHDAQQQQRGAAVDDAGQAGQMAAEGGDLLQREIQPLGQEREERARGALRTEGRPAPRPSRPTPRRNRPAPLPRQISTVSSFSPAGCRQSLGQMVQRCQTGDHGPPGPRGISAPAPHRRRSRSPARPAPCGRHAADPSARSGHGSARRRRSGRRP